MTHLRPWAAARRHPVAVAVVVVVIAVQVTWMVEAACPRMSITECLVAAIVLVAGASMLAIVAHSAHHGLKKM